MSATSADTLTPNNHRTDGGYFTTKSSTTPNDDDDDDDDDFSVHIDAFCVEDDEETSSRMPKRKLQKTINQNLKKIEHNLLLIRNRKMRDPAFLQTKSIEHSGSEEQLAEKRSSRFHETVEQNHLGISRDFKNSCTPARTEELQPKEKDPVCSRCSCNAVSQNLSRRKALFVPYRSYGEFHIARTGYISPISNLSCSKKNLILYPSKLFPENFIESNHLMSENVSRTKGEEKASLEEMSKHSQYLRSSQSATFYQKKSQTRSSPSLRQRFQQMEHMRQMQRKQHMRYLRPIDKHEIIDKQIDPLMTGNYTRNNNRFHSSSEFLLNGNVLENNHPLLTSLSHETNHPLLTSLPHETNHPLLTSLPHETNETNHEIADQSCPSLLRRFFLRLKNATNLTRDSNSLSSTSSSNFVDNFFCWSCFEMTGDDDSLGSVDSESGSDDNGDPNDGDGDDEGDVDDFNNQEDIEAIEYSSGGGDGSDNSSQNDDNNDNWMQDDAANHESNNCNAVYDYDDCEDDEIELARKAGFGFLEDMYSDNIDMESENERQDWLFEALNFDRRVSESEVEILNITGSRTTEDFDGFLS